MKHVFRSLLAASLFCCAAVAQRPAGFNYDEANVGPYKLPELMVLANGKPVRDTATWTKQRRPELLKLYETQIFGRAPKTFPKPVFELTETAKDALGGKAVRKQVMIYLTGKKDGPKAELLVYLPANATGPVPVFLGLNFQGNQSAIDDPAVHLANVWLKGKKSVAAEDTRGKSAEAWQIEKIISRGYGLATIYYGDIEPDFDGGMQYGVRGAFLKSGQKEPADDEWAAIGAWAWGLSRAMDYLQTDSAVDAKRVALMGHSRLGKTALWAGAQDTRFAIVISNDSGEGGAAISRRNFGETVARLNSSFPHWFSKNYRHYSDKVDTMAVDSHMLIALSAPRPVYVASAQEDAWADPKGEFLGLVNAGPAFRLFGKKDLGTDTMPGLHQPIMQDVGYHIRAGKHDVTEYDWEQYLTFADRQFGRK